MEEVEDAGIAGRRHWRSIAETFIVATGGYMTRQSPVGVDQIPCKYEEDCNPRKEMWRRCFT